MRNISFPFGANDLSLKSPDTLSPNQMEELVTRVSETILDLNDTLNHNYANSEVTRFNDSDLGFPVSISNKLRDFLHLNLRYYDHSNGLFNPLTADAEFEWPAQTKEIVTFNPEDKVAARNADIKLTSTLLAAHILDELDRLLTGEIGLPNYLLSTPTASIGRGSSEWEVPYEIDANYPAIPVKLANQTVVLETSNVELGSSAHSIPAHFFNPFSPGVNRIATFPAVIAIADTLAHAKVVAKQAALLRYPTELQALANRWRTNINIVLTNGSLNNYYPQKQ